MRSQKVSVGDSILASQYNKLRDDAKKSSQFLAHEQSAPNMTLKVEDGVVIINNTVVKYSGGDSPTFTAPTTNPRIDLLVLNSSGSLEIIQGTESASPSPPSYPSDKFVICEVYHKPGETSIKDESDGTNGYIYKDARPWIANIKVSFGGNGSDGALVITSGTTTLDLGGQKVFIKNYTYISITGTGQLAFTNPHNEGTLIILKSQGNVTITSSANPAIDLRNLGGAGGNWGSDGYGFGAALSGGAVSGGKRGQYGTYFSGGGGGGAAATDGSNGGDHGTYKGGLGGSSPFLHSAVYPYQKYPVVPGAGGGGGGWNNGSPQPFGGRGAGALYIECGGNLNITSIFNATGTNGTTPSSGYTNGGGGGGGGGSVLIIYKGSLIANTATFYVNGGAGGSGTLGGGSGGAGGNGLALVLPYQES